MAYDFIFSKRKENTRKKKTTCLDKSMIPLSPTTECNPQMSHVHENDPLFCQTMNTPANAGDARDTCLVPGWERSPGGGHGNPRQYSTGRGAWRPQSRRPQRVGRNWATEYVTQQHTSSVLPSHLPFYMSLCCISIIPGIRNNWCASLSHVRAGTLTCSISWHLPGIQYELNKFLLNKYIRTNANSIGKSLQISKSKTYLKCDNSSVSVLEEAWEITAWSKSAIRDSGSHGGTQKDYFRNYAHF